MAVPSKQFLATLTRMARMPNIQRHRPTGHRGEVQLSLLPETSRKANDYAAVWTGVLLDKWSRPRIEVRLISDWTSKHGWRIGWFVQLDNAVDEWHPSMPSAHLRIANYPWYRLDELPNSDHFEVAAGVAARALKIVLAQMLEYVADSQVTEEAAAISERIELQAQAWLKTKENAL